ncbi:uncharacterized protein LOC124420415 [Lucilia cuprina]|uniref:uncharacterized protein LOC124420415 n=1 Tax=Lucilia cuprina TaxID=7375 RepID=UPI001F067D6E|nr:uncharacterized protein LOC124420415 [Lucilia cuprina]
MFEMYKELYPMDNITYRSYLRTFNTKFKLGFGLPRSDTCKTCDELFTKMINSNNEVEMNAISNELGKHQETAEVAYATLKADVNMATGRNTLVVLCVDLQQVILTPNLTHSDVYYQRQYSNYNFCIHNMGENIGNMFLWHEHIGKRGSAEIASCILKYITSNFKPLEAGEIKKLILWSDRCVEQNNNWTILSVCYYLIKLNYFTEVNQKFLTSGHSFLPCDRDFALIEKKKRISKLYTPEDVINMIKTAKTENPFKICEMKLEDFKNFMEITELIKINSECKITKARWIQLTLDDPNTLRLRSSHELSESWSNYSIANGKVDSGRNNIPNLDNLLPSREKNIDICENKKKDLLTMVKYLPNYAKQFYEDICK